MSSPDVRVRLSPEGVKEVLAALRQVQNEGRKANNQSGRGIAGLRSELTQLKRLLPTIGLVTAATGAALLAREALRAADEMGDLAAVTGTTTENLSVFRREAELGNATLEDVRVGLVTLSQRLKDLRAGQASATQGFAELGLSTEDFIGLDSVESIQKVAEALRREEDATRRTALAKQVLGESGARLLPTLISLADKGFAAAADEAARLGAIIGDDLAASAGAAADGFIAIRQQVTGLATQFVAGLAPSIVQTMTTFQEETAGKGVRSMHRFGEQTGRIVVSIIDIFRLLGHAVAGVFEFVGKNLATSLAFWNQVIRGNFSEAKTIFREGLAEQRQILTETYRGIFEDLDRLVTDLTTEPPPIEVPVRTVLEDTVGGALDPVESQKLQKAQLDAVKKRLDAELALQKEQNEALLDENERAFDRGLVSLEQYAERRREIAQETADAEIAALRLQQAALAETLDTTSVGPDAEAERLKIRTELDELDRNVRLRQLSLARELAEIEGDRVDTQRELAAEQLSLANTLDELEGRRHEVFKRNLDDEIRKVEELGARAGRTAEEIASTVDRLTTARTARFNFEDVERAGREALESFNRDAELIRRDAEAGLTSQLEGERRLIELQQQRLDKLRELAEAAQAAAAATGDPETIARAQAFADSVDEITTSLKLASEAGAQLRSGAIDAFQQGLEDLLANADKIESLEDAFRSLARTVVQSLSQIAAKILAERAVLALLNAFGPGAASAGAGAAAAGAWRGGLVRGYAGGGDVRGPRLPIPGPDRVPILAAEGEFVVRRSAVEQPGALAFLRDLNARRITVAQIRAIPKFEGGGLIGELPAVSTARASESTGSGAPGLRIINVVDEKVTHNHMQSASGERVIMNVVKGNSEELRRALEGS